MHSTHVLDSQPAKVAGQHLLAANDPRGALLDQVIGHARQALDAHGRGDAAGFRTHASAARAANERIETRLAELRQAVEYAQANVAAWRWSRWGPSFREVMAARSKAADELHDFCRANGIPTDSFTSH